MRIFNFFQIYAPLITGILIICFSFYYWYVSKLILFETFIALIGLGITFISWNINIYRVYKKRIEELIINLEKRKKLNDGEKDTLKKILEEPATIDTSDIDKITKMEGLKTLKEKGIIKRKLIGNQKVGKIFLYYYSIKKK